MPYILSLFTASDPEFAFTAVPLALACLLLALAALLVIRTIAKARSVRQEAEELLAQVPDATASPSEGGNVL